MAHVDGEHDGQREHDDEQPREHEHDDAAEVPGCRAWLTSMDLPCGEGVSEGWTRDGSHAAIKGPHGVHASEG